MRMHALRKWTRQHKQPIVYVVQFAHCWIYVGNMLNNALRKAKRQRQDWCHILEGITLFFSQFDYVIYPNFNRTFILHLIHIHRKQHVYEFQCAMMRDWKTICSIITANSLFWRDWQRKNMIYVHKWHNYIWLPIPKWHSAHIVNNWHDNMHIK